MDLTEEMCVLPHGYIDLEDVGACVTLSPAPLQGFGTSVLLF